LTKTIPRTHFTKKIENYIPNIKNHITIVVVAAAVNRE